jgi:hypothetical protein
MNMVLAAVHEAGLGPSRRFTGLQRPGRIRRQADVLGRPLHPWIQQ